VRHVVVRFERHVAIANRLEVERVDKLIDPRYAFMSDETVRIDLSFQQRRCREHRGKAGKCPPSAQTEPPPVLDYAHEASEIVLLGRRTYNSPRGIINE
jgi:hypothetical protein